MTDKELRKELIKGIIEEVRGPRFGVDEIINYNPGSEYLVGTLIPVDWKQPINGKNRSIDPDAENINESDYTSSDENSIAPDNILGGNSPILNPNSQIKSFGISFVVNSTGSQTFDICITWARYFKNEDADEAYNLNGLLKKREENDVIWARKSCGEVIQITMDKDNDEYVKSVYDSDDGIINLYIKRLKLSENKSHISMYLINNLKVSPTRKSRPESQDCIFQPSIRINLGNDNSLSSMNTLIESNKELDILYRKKPVLATGHLCSVIWDKIDYYDEFREFKGLMWPDESSINAFENFIRPSIRSEFLPLYPINLPKFGELIDNLELCANKLAYLSPEDLYDNLMKLVDAYEKWINKNESSDDLPKNIIEQFTSKQISALDRIKQGVKLIKSEKLVYLAFCFANKTIHLQNEWKRGNDNYKGCLLSDYCDDESFEWRTFQLAFILISLESIWNDDSIDKSILDLLWIPTGGGKTEAYLGIMAFTMALRRLKSRFGINNEKTGAGVSIISRYTLRLLTVQQFRRTLRMVTAAEFLRVYDNFGVKGWRNSEECGEDWLYGSVRFSAGMWVGGAVTPLHLNKKNVGAIDILKSDESNFGTGNPAQIFNCPVCGAWLAIPEEGLNDKDSHVHIVINTKQDLKTIIKQLDILNDESFVDKFTVTPDDHKDEFFTISLYFKDNVDFGKYVSIVKFIEGIGDIASLNRVTPGYIKSQGNLGRRSRPETDYEIWCTNPNCLLNHEWKEGVPLSDNKSKFPDGNYLREIISPFRNYSKIPIPAYLIDEHVYYRCPTVIVSTADKIARLSFEPKAGSIFGNVNQFNKYYGYCRNNFWPVEHAQDVVGDENNKEIPSFNAPDLIIQDELHLMDGPLGSLFGLYENTVNAIIKKQGGNPKYIASTATINNAENQINALFSKNVSQFPPYGLDISDSFFVCDRKNPSWDENDNGRIYMGMYAPGLGHFTHQIRLYSRLLKIAQDNKDEDNIKYYWTLVGYYNAIRELGSGVSLYKDDIRSRLKYISQKDNMRKLNPEQDSVELSSRMDSTDLPVFLDNLERDGKDKCPDYNAIFTTSMFGTGVDISHLSAMIMNAQPKTNGDYIQSTGRIGRSHGGLIIDLFRSGRPRDLNHYEMFSSYHSRINREVEPVSVSPFSQGCLSRGLGPSLVAFLRNANNLSLGNKWNEDPRNIRLENSMEDIDYFKDITEERLINMGFSVDTISNILKNIDVCVEKWKSVANVDVEEREFVYYEPRNPEIIKRPEKNVVLGDPAHETEKKRIKLLNEAQMDKLPNLHIVFKNAPMSLRDIEDTLGFKV